MEVHAQTSGSFPIPKELELAYFILNLNWDEERYYTTSHHVIEEIKTIWHLEAIAAKYKD